MIGKRNIRSTIQLILGIVLTMAILIGTNVMDKKDVLTSSLPEMGADLTADLAKFGETMGTVASKDFIQSKISDTGLLSKVLYKAPVEEKPNPMSEAVGGVIDGAGTWVTGTWDKSVGLVKGKKDEFVEENPVALEAKAASGSFDEVYQPYISNVPGKRVYMDGEEVTVEEIAADESTS